MCTDVSDELAGFSNRADDFSSLTMEIASFSETSLHIYSRLHGVTSRKLINVIVTFFKVSDPTNIHCLVIIM